MLDHGRPLGLRLGDEFIADRLQHIGVDADASVLHLREHPHERHLEVVMEDEQPLRGHRLAERHHEVVHGERRKARLLGSIRRGPAVEIELPFGRARRREFHATVSEQQRTEVIDIVGRIEQVGSEAGIDRKVTDIDTTVVEPSHRSLGSVHRHGATVGAEEDPQRVEHRRVGEKVALHETDIARITVDHEGEPTVDAGFRHTESEHIGTSAGKGKRSGRSGGRVVHRDIGGQRLSGLTARLAENRSETIPERAELEEVEKLLDDVGIGCALGQVIEAKVELDVANEHHHLDVVADVGLIACEVLSQLRREFVEGGVDAVDTATLVDQLRGRLLAHTGDAGEVVGIVAAQGCVLDIVDRPHAGAFKDARLVVEGVIADAAPVVEHLDVRVLDQLIAIAIAGHDDDIVATISALGGQGRNDVIGFEADLFQRRNRHRIEHLAHDTHLLAKNVRRCFPLRLVGGCHLVPEGRLGPIERDGDVVGFVILHQVDEHRREAEHSVGHLSRRGGHVGGQGKERSIGERVSIDEHHGRHCGRP